MPSFDHPVGLGEQQLRHFEIERKGIDALARSYSNRTSVSCFADLNLCVMNMR
jgi:hypothetical protein